LSIALAKLPDNTVTDGEVVAFDDEGRPSFNALQNYGSAVAPVAYYIFDVMVFAGRDVMREPLEKRRELLEKNAAEAGRTHSVCSALRCRVPRTRSISEGSRAKRDWSPSGALVCTNQDSGRAAWMKMRVNRGQEFVIGGYTRGTRTFDARCAETVSLVETQTSANTEQFS
jgi:ATP dependent DNA ligase-like protein